MTKKKLSSAHNMLCCHETNFVFLSFTRSVEAIAHPASVNEMTVCCLVFSIHVREEGEVVRRQNLLYYLNPLHSTQHDYVDEVSREGYDLQPAGRGFVVQFNQQQE